MFPAITIYTDHLPHDVGGCANAFLVRIRPEYRNDAGIHRHEYEHVEQFWIAALITVMSIGGILHSLHLPIEGCLAGLAAHSLLYRFAPAYRMWAEVEAYRIQLRHYLDDRSRLFAGFLASKYRLEITPGEALAEITKG